MNPRPHGLYWETLPIEPLGVEYEVPDQHIMVVIDKSKKEGTKIVPTFIDICHGGM